MYRKVENSNSVFGWDDMSHGYKATNQMTSQKPADFLSRLNQQVTVSAIWILCIQVSCINLNQLSYDPFKIRISMDVPN